jgi:hypothetical protein
MRTVVIQILGMNFENWHGAKIPSIWIDPDDDIVFAWRWFRNDPMDEMISKILGALATAQSNRPRPDF